MLDSRVDEPQVGIFWYTPELGVFGEESKPISELPTNGIKTIAKRHDAVWKKRHQRALARKDTTSPFYTSNDGYNIPRGRIMVENGTPVVLLGDWIDEYPEAKEDILDVFNLPPDTEFRKDIHWNVGHGWSGDHMM